MKLKEFLASNREIAQIIYGVFLIVLIPLLIAYNTITIIERYNKNIDITLQRQSLIIARTVNTLLAEDLQNENALQNYASKLVEDNKDILAINILFPKGDKFAIKAANDLKAVGKESDSYYYKIAWTQPKGDALVTDSLNLAGAGDDIQAASEETGRFWLTTSPLYDSQNKKTALLSLKISSGIVDELTQNNRNTSIVILIATIFITILFLVAAVRLWDYALLYKKIKEVDQMKDEFISIASHELRTPITCIKGYGSLMLDGSLGEINEEVRKGAAIIGESANRLAMLVDDLLNVSRIEQNRIEIILENADPRSMIENTLSELKVQSDAKGLALKFMPHAEKLPLISIDPDKFKQILINIIGNSIKYTEKGQVEVITEEKNDGNILEIRVKDTGIGMSSKARESLFQKFYRIKTEKTQKISGTGLGLWITKQLVEMMNGKIMVDSIENVGTQMTLQFKTVKPIKD